MNKSDRNYEATWRSSLAFFADSVAAAPHVAEKLLEIYTFDSYPGGYPAEPALRAATCLVKKVSRVVSETEDSELRDALWEAAHELRESDSEDEGNAGTAFVWALGHKK